MRPGRAVARAGADLAAGESESDASIIARSQARPDAFARIFERHFDEIHRYLRRRHPEAAEELAAEVFTVAFDRRGRFEARSDSARPWLYGIASNLLYKRRRSELRALRAHARSGGLASTGPSELAGTVARIDVQRQSAAIARALATLGAEDRNTLLLYALADLSYEEVAAALDVPIGTVRSRLARARRRCEPLLAPLAGQEA